MFQKVGKSNKTYRTLIIKAFPVVGAGGRAGWRPRDRGNGHRRRPAARVPGRCGRRRLAIGRRARLFSKKVGRDWPGRGVPLPADGASPWPDAVAEAGARRDVSGRRRREGGTRGASRPNGNRPAGAAPLEGPRGGREGGKGAPTAAVGPLPEAGLWEGLAAPRCPPWQITAGRGGGGAREATTRGCCLLVASRLSCRLIA